jgi:hypothetical protein
MKEVITWIGADGWVWDSAYGWRLKSPPRNVCDRVTKSGKLRKSKFETTVGVLIKGGG